MGRCTKNCAQQQVRCEYRFNYKDILIKIFELVLTEQKVQLDSITTIDNRRLSRNFIIYYTV